MQDFYAELNVLGRKVELFVNSFTPRGGGIVKSLVTTVTLRVPQSLDSVPTAHWVFSGSAILNPKDQFDGIYGVQVAYKRAWSEMERMFGPFSKAEWDQLRLSRWKVMEGAQKCQQDAPEPLLPPETIAKLNQTQSRVDVYAGTNGVSAKYPHTADEMVPSHPEYYPTVGVLLDDLTERYGWKNSAGWRVSEAGFIPTNERDSFMRDYSDPKVIRWREVTNWEAERDPEAARRAQLLAKYPHDAKVQNPSHLDVCHPNVGVLFDDLSEGYGWNGAGGWWIFWDTVPLSHRQMEPTFRCTQEIIRWRDITDWEQEKAEHDRQGA
jgi:hypothetical protein